MKSLNIAIATGISGLFAISLAAFDLKASAQAQPSTIRNTVTTLANLADGIYYFIDPRDKRNEGFYPRRFEFRKSGNQVTGYFVEAPSGICIEGFIKGNIVTGIGLVESKSINLPPKPIFGKSALRDWGGSSALKVGGEVVFYFPFKVNTNSRGIGYFTWWKYRNVVLNVDGYERRDDLRRSTIPQKCQMTDSLTGGKIFSESELFKLK